MEIPLGSKLLWKDGTLAFEKVKCEKGGFWWESLDPAQQKKDQWLRSAFRLPDKDLLNSPYYTYGDKSRFDLFILYDKSKIK